MQDMIAFKGNLPAFITSTKTANLFAAAASLGFPFASIKGKVFHIQRGDERTLVTRPGEDDVPASYLEVVIVAANPAKSKVFYANGYEEGSASKPDCYSNDGISPAADAQSPVSKKCALCPNNQWGSRISDNGGKGKACSDSMRLAICPAGDLGDPMLLRVPAASLKVLGQYGAQLARRGVEPRHVVTRIAFDHSVAHPALVFKAVRYVEAHEHEAISNLLAEETDLVEQIIGTKPMDTTVQADDMADDIAGTPPVQASSEKMKAAEAKTPVAEDDEEPVAPTPKKAKLKAVQTEPVQEEAPTESKAKSYDSIDSALDDMEFDD